MYTLQTCLSKQRNFLRIKSSVKVHVTLMSWKHRHRAVRMYPRCDKWPSHPAGYWSDLVQLAPSPHFPKSNCLQLPDDLLNCSRVLGEPLALVTDGPVEIPGLESCHWLLLFGLLEPKFWLPYVWIGSHDAHLMSCGNNVQWVCTRPIPFPFIHCGYWSQSCPLTRFNFH